MAASALHALQLAIEAAERQRDQMRKLLAQARQGLQAAQSQHEQLSSYAQETEGRWGVREDVTLQPTALNNHYQFMGRLFQAMDLQSRVIAQNEGRVQQAEQRLLAAELRLTSLRQLMERRLKEQALVEARRDQKQTDERASRMRRSAWDAPDV